MPTNKEILDQLNVVLEAHENMVLKHPYNESEAILFFRERNKLTSMIGQVTKPMEVQNAESGSEG